MVAEAGSLGLGEPLLRGSEHAWLHARLRAASTTRRASFAARPRSKRRGNSPVASGSRRRSACAASGVTASARKAMSRGTPRASASAIVSPRSVIVPTSVAFVTSFVAAPFPSSPAWTGSPRTERTAPSVRRGRPGRRSTAAREPASASPRLPWTGASISPTSSGSAERSQRIVAGPTVDISIAVVPARTPAAIPSALDDGPEGLRIGEHREDRLPAAGGVRRARGPRRAQRDELVGPLGRPVPDDRLVAGVEEPAGDPTAHRPHPEHAHGGHPPIIARNVTHDTFGVVAKVTAALWPSLRPRRPGSVASAWLRPRRPRT